jgi:glycerophosphoryl diester phosphodiesterase
MNVAISAHSGGAAGHRRVHLEDFESAISSGAEYVELDIRRAGDGTLVCHHDPAVAGRRVAELKYRELCRATGYEVPRVADVLALLGPHVLGHLDLKETGVEAEVLERAGAAFGPSRFVVTTMHDSSISLVTQAFPGVRTALSLGRSPRSMRWHELPTEVWRDFFPLSRIRRCGAQWIAVNKMLARRGVLQQAARHGIGAMVWTVDEDALIDRFLADPRVNVLITNRPAYAVDRRRRVASGQ